MKKKVPGWYLICAVSLFPAFFAITSQTSFAAVALVYSGPGTCPEGCTAAAAGVAERAGLSVRFVTVETLRPEIFSDAAIWIQPGGDAIVVAKLMSQQQKDLIRNFVFRGGSYLGFCAGAFLADATVDDANTIPGLGLIPGEVQDYKLANGKTILPIRWGARFRYLYFEDGGYFTLRPSQIARPFAWYPEGLAAAVGAYFGRGRVVVSGVHPEAPEEWKDSAANSDPDGSDYDLAQEMIRRALGKKLSRGVARGPARDQL